MSLDVFDNYECEGQLSLEDIYEIEIPEGLFAISKVFARAQKQMSLSEYKAFTYALANIRFTEENPNKLLLDKKTLAAIVGVQSDTDHLSVDLKRSIGRLPKHSFIEIDDVDNDFYESGVVVTRLTMHKNNVAITFNEDYMGFFSQLTGDYITMWSGDIYKMSSERSIAFYEELRLNTDTRAEVCSKGFGVKALKELFGMAKEDYVDSKGHFQRTHFEKYVIDPLCEDLARCKMINLVLQPDGKYYEKVKKNGRVLGYRFYWSFSSHPSVATADEVKELQERVDKDARVLAVAKDLVNGKKKTKAKSTKTKFSNFGERKYDMDEFEAMLLSTPPTK